MAALEVYYDQKPENDFGPGDPVIIVSDAAELNALLDRVSAASARQPCPSIITAYVASDPYRRPSVRAGIGAEQGYVQVNSRDSRRATLGNAAATGQRTYDFQGHGEEVELRHEVPLATVRAVLTSYLEHDGVIPDEFPELHTVNMD